MAKTFAAAINCIDGRIQIPVIAHLRSSFGVDYVDMITEPGVNRLLAENESEAVISSIRGKLEISVSRHGAKLVAIVGHSGCAGNPADREAQIAHLLAAKETVRAWDFGIRIVGLWVDDNGVVSEVE
jgi:carbonic anhydrase